MADKHIIIDGVDVSGCPYYIDSEGGCSSHDCECIKCIHNVCFYKDYKAKEQELEELQETIDDFITDNSSLYCYDGKQPSNLDELQECMQSSMNEFVKYKQALDEIEKLAKENVELLEIINQAKDGDNSE